MARRPAHVRRPDPRDDRAPSRDHRAASRRAATSTRRRAIATAQAAANTTVETRTATAAPVAPHSAPSTATSGITTSASSPCVTIRSRGRPIVTGSDFDQPSANWIAAATRMIRAASTAPTYSAPNTSSMSHGIASSATGTATTISPAATSVYVRTPARTLRSLPRSQACVWSVSRMSRAGELAADEPRLRRLRDPEETDLGRARDDAEDERHERRPQRDDTGPDARLEDERDHLRAGPRRAEPRAPAGSGGKRVARQPRPPRWRSPARRRSPRSSP